jgi:endonuclease/exonuclease/phosphatase (EEP) superfamily protein YafD
MPFFSSCGNVFELVAHFRFQLLLASVLMAVLVIVFSCRIFLVPVAISILINGAAIYPLYFGAVEKAPQANFRVLSCNLNSTNQNFEHVTKLFNFSGADVICVQELSPAMDKFFAAKLTEYPYRLVDPRDDNFGIGTYSRHYITNNQVIPSENPDLPSGAARTQSASIQSLKVGIKFGARDITVINTHPPPPIRGDYYDWRNKQLEDIARTADKAEGPVFVAGDLNCSRFSPTFEKVLQIGNLKDSEIGFGIQPTWPTQLMVPLGIPIDHVLYKGPVLVVERELKLPTGSDHVPVMASFRIADRW